MFKRRVWRRWEAACEEKCSNNLLSQWLRETSPFGRGSLHSRSEWMRSQFCQIKEIVLHFRRRPGHYFNLDQHFLFHSRSGTLHRLILEGQYGPFSLKYLCQGTEKFLEGTCWNLFLPSVPALHRGHCNMRCSKMIVELKVDINFFLLISSLQLQKQTNQKKKKVLAWSHVLAPTRCWVHFQLWWLDTHHPLDRGCWERDAPTGSRDRELLRSLSMNGLSTTAQM